MSGRDANILHVLFAKKIICYWKDSKMSLEMPYGAYGIFPTDCLPFFQSPLRLIVQQVCELHLDDIAKNTFKLHLDS